MGAMTTAFKVLVVKPGRRDHPEQLDADVRIILKCIFEK
jgi:hypothetical protein